ncbi:MAG: tetratricopeptide repeat-containing sensor histidine kinase [Flavobacteriales bacterium]|nr:tetratricopeptide repeat-containing sensor histidine kinase [Flavobacteriales bacterium]
MLKKTYIFYFLVSICITTTSFAQSKTDSLSVILGSINDPQSKIEYLNTEANKSGIQDTTKTFTLLRKSIEIGKKRKDYSSIGDSYRKIGNIYYDLGLGKQMKSNYSTSYEFYILSNDSLGLAKITNNLGTYYNEWVNDYDKALLYFEKSFKLKKILGVNNKTLSTTSYNLGTVHLNLSSYIKSLNYYFETLELLYPLEDKKTISIVNNQIGKVYLRIQEYDLAKKFIDVAIKINLEIYQKSSLADNYLLLGKMYNSLNNRDSALFYLKESEKIYSKDLNKLGLGHVYTNYINIYLKTNEFNKIFKYAFTAKDLFLESGSVYELATIYNYLGIAYYKNNNFEKAKINLDKSFVLSNKYNFTEISKDHYYYKSKISYSERNFKQAYVLFQTYSELKDSIFGLRKIQIASDLEDKYAINKKEIELSLLSQEKQKIELESDRNKTVAGYLKIVIILVLVVLSLLFYLYYSNRRLNDRLEELVEERTKELKESNKLLVNSKKNEEDVSRMKSDLLKNISESLKTPIFEIQNLVSILKDENEENYELYEQLELITNSSFRLNAIINSITELYKIEDKKAIKKESNFELNELISDIIESYKNQAETRDLALSISDNNEIVFLTQDRDSISNAINHLMKTVLDYATKGVVEATVKKNYDNTTICIYASNFSINKKLFNQDLSINNSSIKNNSKQLDRMFVSFFVIKKIIEKIDGNILWVEDNNGDGIKFTISFPILSMKTSNSYT